MKMRVKLSFAYHFVFGVLMQRCSGTAFWSREERKEEENEKNVRKMPVAPKNNNNIIITN
jgi:hypothetical protein